MTGAPAPGGRVPAGRHTVRASSVNATSSGASATVRAHVALGSNLGERAATIERACVALRALSSGGALECSPLYESAPLGPSDQPDYLNAVCAFDTALAPLALLAELQRIERAAGRVRPAARWSARPLDLDLLLYGERIIEVPSLAVPHPGIAAREFVLRPLADLDGALEVPGRGRVGALLDALGAPEIRRLSGAQGRCRRYAAAAGDGLPCPTPTAR